MKNTFNFIFDKAFIINHFLLVKKPFGQSFVCIYATVAKERPPASYRFRTAHIDSHFGYVFLVIGSSVQKFA